MSNEAISDAVAEFVDGRALAQRLSVLGNDFWQRGWSRGTSSNYSVVVRRDPLRLMITASGKDKGHLKNSDFVIVDEHADLNPPDQAKSSAETHLHSSAAIHRNAGAVLHTHSVWAAILSDHFFPVGGIWIEDFEMLKGLEGIHTHQSRYWLPIFDNTQDISRLRVQIENYWRKNPNALCWGYLLRKHGMYCWGNSLSQAIRHMEVHEYLLECVGRQISLK